MGLAAEPESALSGVALDELAPTSVQPRHITRLGGVLVYQRIEGARRIALLPAWSSIGCRACSNPGEVGAQGAHQLVQVLSDLAANSRGDGWRSVSCHSRWPASAGRSGLRRLTPTPFAVGGTTHFEAKTMNAHKEKLRASRLSLAHTFLTDSEQPQLSHHGRVSAAFDAGYLATLVALDAGPGDDYEHPSPGALRDGQLRLSKDLYAGFERASVFLEHRYDWQPQKFDLKAMQGWAEAVIKAACP